jgi:hypothetical protein
MINGDGSMCHANGVEGRGARAKLGRSQPANTPQQILQNFPIVPCSNPSELKTFSKPTFLLYSWRS